jgi:hypothetical protein
VTPGREGPCALLAIVTFIAYAAVALISSGRAVVTFSFV